MKMPDALSFHRDIGPSVLPESAGKVNPPVG
jgi:hypothetical protein